MTQVDISKFLKYKMEKLRYFVLCYIFISHFQKISCSSLLSVYWSEEGGAGGEADLKRLMKSQVILSHIDGRQ